MSIAIRRRWSDNDRHFGPFTLAVGDYRRLGIVLDSGADESPGCNLRFYIFGCTLLIDLPPIIRPWRQKIVAHSWDAATVERMGRNWYWDEHPREYGFSVSEGFLQVFLGRQTHDSATEQSWCKFLPWTQWRFVRHSFYGLDGYHFWTAPKGMPWSEGRKIEEMCPSVSFEFEDFDYERITASTKIEEREWLFGEGWFKWLSLFRKPKVRRSLAIEFSKETGKRKGSWKGGTLGHGIEMLPGELHEAAFKRYCREHDMTFIGLSKV
jgi:hypothetical protein